MADPLGIIGVIAVAGQILSLTVKLGLDWKDAPEDAKSFLNEIQTLKTVLSETHTNIIVNEDFNAAFRGRRSALLPELGDSTQPTNTFPMIETCKQLLDDLLSDLEKRTEGHRFGWERLKGAFLNKKTRGIIQDLQRQCQTLNSLVSLDALSLGLKTHRELQQVRQEQEDWQQQYRSKQILDWLSTADHVAQQSDFLRRRQAGTGQWLLDSQEYQQWVATSQTTLFCPGIPGAGKTMLTSIVVDDLQNRFRDDGNVSIAYLYCNFRRQTEQTVENLLSSVLQQLAHYQPSVPECIRTLHDTARGQRPTLEQLSSTLQTLVKTLPRVYIIVDALDECQLADGSRAKFLDEIFDLQSGSKVNLFATSRLIMGITDRFSHAKSLKIWAHEEDVRQYLAGSMSQLPACVAKSPQLQEEIMAKIVDAVEGMFLLAQLHLNSLKGKRSAKNIRAALGALHTGSGAYDKAYDDAMERIASQLEEQKELARQVLMWITCAVRPLKTVQLQEALAVELGESHLDPDNLPEIEDILSVCAGLVTVDEGSKIIRLVHYTTQEYFSRTSHRWFPKAHCSITETFMTYLSFDMFNPSTKLRYNSDVKADSLFYYAFWYWVNHASMLESESCHQMVSNFLHRRMSMTWGHIEDFEHWRELHSTFVDSLLSLGRKEIFRASRIGESRHVQYLLRRGALPNAKDGSGWSPISIAVYEKHIDSVGVLLEWDGTDINSRDRLGETPLFIALKGGERGIIEMLLRAEGIDMTAVTNTGETLLHAAASGGLGDIFQSFVDMDIDCSNLNAQERYGNTPLHMAAKAGHVAVVQILLDSVGIEIHPKDWLELTPLHLAARHGHPAVIQMLLEVDPTTINAKTKAGQTPFDLAVERHHGDAVQEFLNFDAAAFKVKINLGATPLWIVAQLGRDQFIKFLLGIDGAGMGLESKDRLERKVLAIVAEQRQQMVVELLEEAHETHGVEPDRIGDNVKG